jgi:hypothetical protein
LTGLPSRGRLIVLAALLSGRPAESQSPVAHHGERGWHGAMPSGEPESTPADGVRVAAGPWSVLLHGFASFGGTWASGRRGVDQSFGTSMLSAEATRSGSRGTLSVRLMLSGEPLMGPRGYPVLLQTGETADGLRPLRDRQHPHNLLSELAVAYRRSLPDDLTAFGYVALVGEPAFGPVPFMRRASGRELPEPPIGHHFQDATHETFGVMTLGLVSGRALTIEASLFNGRQPDPDRWDVDPIRLDSYSIRARVALGPSWSVQGSFAQVAQPERLHPTIDQARLSASATHNRPLRSGNWQTTLAFGRNLSRRREILLAEAIRIFPAPILAHYLSLAELTNLPADSAYLVFPSQVQSGWLLESTLTRGRGGSVLMGRLERVVKSELFDPSDIRHSQLYSVGKISLGYLWQRPIGRMLSLGIGVVGSLHLLPSALREDYGGLPRSAQLFSRIKWAAVDGGP